MTSLHYSSFLEAQIISQTPGRVRLRVRPAYRQQQKIAPIVNALKARLEIYRVKTNIPSGSITVLHGRELLTSQDMSIVLQDLGINLVQVTQEPRRAISSSSSAAAEVIKTVTDLDQRIKIATDNAIDLRLLLPLGLGVMAMRQLIVKGWQLELIPWYVLAWYAFDSFLKLNSND
ncbi:MAG: HMA2 domain-containing protein [Xenococcus sp. (in: cyanobacteria)]